MYELVYTAQARKDAKKIASSGLKGKTQDLLSILEKNPFQNPPPFEAWVGDLTDVYKRQEKIFSK